MPNKLDERFTEIPKISKNLYPNGALGVCTSARFGRNPIADVFNVRVDTASYFSSTKSELKYELFESSTKGSTLDIHDVFGDGSCLATYTFNGNINDLGGSYNGTTASTLTYSQFSPFSGRQSLYLVTNDTVDLPVPPDQVDTVSFWISSPGFSTPVIGSTAPAGEYLPCQFSITGNSHIAWQHDLYFEEGVKSLAGTFWTHVVINRTSIGSEFTLFLNGEGIKPRNLSTSNITANTTATYRLNEYAGSSNGGFFISQLRFFNRKLTPDEILKLYFEGTDFVKTRKLLWKVYEVDTGEVTYFRTSFTDKQLRFFGQEDYILSFRSTCDLPVRVTAVSYLPYPTEVSVTYNPTDSNYSRDGDVVIIRIPVTDFVAFRSTPAYAVYIDLGLAYDTTTTPLECYYWDFKLLPANLWQDPDVQVDLAYDLSYCKLYYESTIKSLKDGVYGNDIGLVDTNLPQEYGYLNIVSTDFKSMTVYYSQEKILIPSVRFTGTSGLTVTSYNRLAMVIDSFDTVTSPVYYEFAVYC